MFSHVLLLVVTGYGLYYAGKEETRPWIRMAHWITGVLAAFGLALHACLGKRSSQGRPLARRLHRRLFDAGSSGTECPSEVLGREQPSNAP
jgi:hypothetical protein